MTYHIMVVKITGRRDRSARVQEVLSEYGCAIKVRLGLHDAGEACSDDGVLILQLTGEKAGMLELERALNGLDGVRARMVTLD
jgi:hypothetical protein